MRKRFPIFIVIAMILVGCSNAQVSEQEQTPDDIAAHEHHGSGNEPDEAISGYTLSAVINEEYQLVFDTNLELSEDNYGKSHEEGQGHVHLYINDQLIGPLLHMGPHQTEPFLFDGENEIRLVLASNNHIESIYNISYELAVDYTKPASS